MKRREFFIEPNSYRTVYSNPEPSKTIDGPSRIGKESKQLDFYLNPEIIHSHLKFLYAFFEEIKFREGQVYEKYKDESFVQEIINWLNQEGADFFDKNHRKQNIILRHLLQNKKNKWIKKAMRTVLFEQNENWMKVDDVFKFINRLQITELTEPQKKELMDIILTNGLNANDFKEVYKMSTPEKQRLKTKVIKILEETGKIGEKVLIQLGEGTLELATISLLPLGIIEKNIATNKHVSTTLVKTFLVLSMLQGCTANVPIKQPILNPNINKEVVEKRPFEELLSEAEDIYGFDRTYLKLIFLNNLLLKKLPSGKNYIDISEDDYEKAKDTINYLKTKDINKRSFLIDLENILNLKYKKSLSDESNLEKKFKECIENQGYLKERLYSEAGMVLQRMGIQLNNNVNNRVIIVVNNWLLNHSKTMKGVTLLSNERLEEIIYTLKNYDNMNGGEDITCINLLKSLFETGFDTLLDEYKTNEIPAELSDSNYKKAKKHIDRIINNTIPFLAKGKIKKVFNYEIVNSVYKIFNVFPEIAKSNSPEEAVSILQKNKNLLNPLNKAFDSGLIQFLVKLGFFDKQQYSAIKDFIEILNNFFNSNSWTEAELEIKKMLENEIYMNNKDDKCNQINILKRCIINRIVYDKNAIKNKEFQKIASICFKDFENVLKKTGLQKNEINNFHYFQFNVRKILPRMQFFASRYFN